MPIRFQFRWIPFVATIIVVAIGVSLGQWQTGRAQDKRAIAAAMQERGNASTAHIDGPSVDIDALEYRSATVRGTFVPQWTSYLENRPYNGVAGFYILTPLKIADSDATLMVARGWVPRDVADRLKIPVFATPATEVEVAGVVRRTVGQVMQLGQAPVPTPGGMLQNLDIAAYAQASGLPLMPFVLLETSAQQDGMVRDWPAPSLGIDKHQGYAVQWYALSLMALLFFIVTGWRRGKK